jgi:shikimate dehydrogenase
VTSRYCVFGNPIAHSKSPRIHTLFAQQTGQDLSYEAILAPVDGFAGAVHEFITTRGVDAKGANVTVPFKEEAFRLARHLTPRAEAAGAVNTLTFDGDAIHGDNTDGAGLVRDITTNLGFAIGGRRIMLLGAGGAARGVILPLLEQQPAELFIANRTADKALQLASSFRVRGGGFDQLAGRSFELVINATSTGLSDTPLPLPPSAFAPGCLAYEMVYGRDTPFMAQARNVGALTADGLGMLVEQAAEAFFVWRGIRPQTAPVIRLLQAT